MPSPIGHALGGICLGWGVGGRRNLRAAAAGLGARAPPRQPRWALAIALAWGSHILFDWLSNDTRPPIGVMALWPFSQEHYKAPIEVFPPVSRRYWESRFWIYNLR